MSKNFNNYNNQFQNQNTETNRKDDSVKTYQNENVTLSDTNGTITMSPIGSSKYVDISLNTTRIDFLMAAYERLLSEQYQEACRASIEGFND